MKAGNPKKYEGLEISAYTKWLLDNEPKLFKKYCNGVGSKTNWFNTLLWHLTPNTIWFMGITPASDLHDVGYSFPCIFKTEEEALEYKTFIDREFLINLYILINRKKHTNKLSRILKYCRARRADLYYLMVGRFGRNSFLKGKIIYNKLED